MSTQPDFDPIGLPENYRGEFNVRAMMPGDTAFLYNHCLRQDLGNGGLYLNVETEVNDDARKPSWLSPTSKSDRVGVIRVYQEHGGQPLDGYVVDISDVNPGKIATEKIIPTDEDQGYDRTHLINQASRWAPILGLRYRDAEGEIQYQGLPWLKDQADYLGEVFDSIREKSKTLPREGLMPGVELLPVDEADEATKSDETTEAVVETPAESDAQSIVADAGSPKKDSAASDPDEK